MAPKRKKLADPADCSEIKELDSAVNYLEHAIAEFPIGASTPDDFKPVEVKIAELRESLKAIDARNLTLKSIIDMGVTEDAPMGDLVEAMEKLNESTANYLINTKTLKLCLHSRAIQDIIYKNAGSKDIQDKTKSCLNNLFILNKSMKEKDEHIKQLMKKQLFLKIQCHSSIYDYQSFLKEKEARRNRQLQETNPNFVRNKEKLAHTIHKINTMKKLITNLIASMCKKLDEKEELVDMLAKHKEIINLESITEMVQCDKS